VIARILSPTFGAHSAVQWWANRGGARDARWLGVVSQKGAEGFEIPAQAAQCVHGLNFALMVRDQNRGYRVGPVRPRAGANVTLVIEKYAGLSYAGLGGSDLR
jgi:hypothetical protein